MTAIHTKSQSYLSLDLQRGQGGARGPGMHPAGRFLSKDECLTLAKQISGFAAGGGDTGVYIDSTWSGNLRWAHNQVSTCGDIRNNDVGVERAIRGARNRVSLNELDAASLEAAVRRAERLLVQESEDLEAPLWGQYTEPYDSPTLWFDRTYQLGADERAEAMRKLTAPATAAGMMSAGYIEVSAHGTAVMGNGARSIYYPYTQAQFSVTVRDPAGTASGWAGVDWNDWGRVDAEKLAATALDKCLRSRNPVAAEPGRYTTILEPQAVCDLVSPMFPSGAMDRYTAEHPPPFYPFTGEHRGETKIGESIFDARITISADPMDPDLGFLPFSPAYSNTRSLEVFHPAEWFKQGVLNALAYDREPYGIHELGVNTGLPTNGAFKISGGTTTVDEMIATTKRGVLVTRFSDVHVVDRRSLLLTGFTRDGLWLIENGKISKAIKNFKFTDSPLFVLNNIEQLGVPQRVFHPDAPVVAPAIKVSDFSFTALADAV